MPDRASDAAAAPPAGLTGPQAALWWLDRGGLALGPDWERAHAICQSGEGEPGCDLVHGLAHLIEGDLPNARYWYRAAGEADAGSDPQSEWRRIAAKLGGLPSG